MCGIAGIMYKTTGSLGATGQALIDMLDGCQHRGPDSTGFALYSPSADDRLRLRFFVGEGDEAGAAVERIKASLAEHGASIAEDQIVGNNYRCTVAFTGDIQKLAYAMEHAAKVISIGTSLEIVKDVGSAHEVDDRYSVHEFRGT
ncbi:MAG: amidophosphoribosyltransferase, partial [Gammaproteobacteria bacterium]|nr:amidophosphoribosyltransferase [Gammaproteobacteria bacterium]